MGTSTIKEARLGEKHSKIIYTNQSVPISRRFEISSSSSWGALFSQSIKSLFRRNTFPRTEVKSVLSQMSPANVRFISKFLADFVKLPG